MNFFLSFLFLVSLSFSAYTTTLSLPADEDYNLSSPSFTEKTLENETVAFSSEQESSPCCVLMMLRCDCCKEKEKIQETSDRHPNTEQRETLSTTSITPSEDENLSSSSEDENSNLEELQEESRPSQKQIAAYCPGCDHWYLETNPSSQNQQILCEEDPKKHLWRCSHRLELQKNFLPHDSNYSKRVIDASVLAPQATLQFMSCCSQCKAYFPSLLLTENHSQVLCKKNNLNGAWEKISFQEVMDSIPSTHVLYRRPKNSSSSYYVPSSTANYQKRDQELEEIVHNADLPIEQRLEAFSKREKLAELFLPVTPVAPTKTSMELFLSFLDTGHALFSSFFPSQTEIIPCEKEALLPGDSNETTPLLPPREKKRAYYSSCSSTD